MNMWLVYPDQDSANNDLNIINNNIGYPLDEFNAATGLDNPTAEQTTQWALPVLTDANAASYPASWVFPAPDPQYYTPPPGKKRHIGDSIDPGGLVTADYDPTWFPSSI